MEEAFFIGVIDLQIRIAGIVPESFVDGAGIRYAIFMQGCKRHCRGCHNPQTQDLLGGYLMDTADIINEFKQNILASGITLTGGEPLLQIDAATELACAAKKYRLNVWCYTGFTFEMLPPEADKLLNFVDVLVDGEYRESERDLSLLFRGSKNQRVIDLNETRRQHKIVLW